VANRNPFLKMTPARVVAALPLGVAGVVTAVQGISALLEIGSLHTSDEFERVAADMSIPVSAVLVGFAAILLVAAVMVVVRRPLPGLWLALLLFSVFVVIWVGRDVVSLSRAQEGDWLMLAPWVYLAGVAVCRLVVWSRQRRRSGEVAP
jgi:hypothetical protein